MKNQFDTLDIYIPRLEDLWFRQKMLADKRTMDYNIGFEPYDGYNPLDGTIDFSPEKWKRWHDGWTDKRNRCFYAYIVRKSDGVWIGDMRTTTAKMRINPLYT